MNFGLVLFKFCVFVYFSPHMKSLPVTMRIVVWMNLIPEAEGQTWIQEAVVTLPWLDHLMMFVETEEMVLGAKLLWDQMHHLDQLCKIKHFLYRILIN